MLDLNNLALKTREVALHLAPLASFQHHSQVRRFSDDFQKDSFE